MKTFENISVDDDDYIIINFTLYGHPHIYVIGPHQISPYNKQDWIDHLSDKIWFSPRYIAPLCEAFDYVLSNLKIYETDKN